MSSLLFFFLMLLPPPRSTLFPYTTLFRSALQHIGALDQRQCAANVLLHQEDCGTHLMDFRDLLEGDVGHDRSEEHTSELQSHSDLVCRLLLEKKKKKTNTNIKEINISR